MTPTRSLVATLLLLFLLLPACGFSDQPADLCIANGPEPPTLDPARMTGVAEGRIAAALFEGLTVLDSRTLAVRPALAESYSVSDDGREWTFRLRDDARWSDGAPVTAGDFRWSWLRLLDPKTGAAYAGLLFPVTGAREFQGGQGSREDVGIRAPNERTLVVSLLRPVPYFPSLVAFFTLLPVPRQAVERHGNRWTRAGKIVTNGAFHLREWRFYREILLERSPTYRGPAPAGVKRLRIIPVTDANTQLNLYATGVVDIAFSVPSPVVDRLADRPDFVNGPRLATSFLRLNVRRESLDDIEFRRALAGAIDREAITRRVTRAGEIPATSFTPPVLPEYEPPPALEPTKSPPEDLAKTRPLSLLLPENPDYAVLASVIAHQLSEHLGLSVRLDIREWKVYLASRRRGDYDLALSLWIGDYPDPTTFLDCFRSEDGNNQTGWGSAVYDRCLAEAAEIRAGESVDAWRERRRRTLRSAERILIDAAPIVPLYHPTVRFLVSDRVGGFQPNMMGLVRFADLTVREDGR